MSQPKLKKIGNKQSELIQLVFECLAPSIREEILPNSKFAAELGMQSVPTVKFDRFGVSFDQTQLYNGIREVYAGTANKKIEDLDSNYWNIWLEKADSKNEQVSTLVVKSDEGYEVDLSNYAPLSPDPIVRTKFFEKEIKSRYYSEEFQKKWNIILVKRPLEDSEYKMFYGELMNTPDLFIDQIRENVENEDFSASTLVPNSLEYFELLVGKFDNSKTVSEYAKNGAKKHLGRLIKWNPIEGLKKCLLLSNHSSISAQIGIDQIDDSDFLPLLKQLIDEGDPVSQLGAIELGFKNVKRYPSIESHLCELIEILKNDDLTDLNGRFNLLSGLYKLVEGELARTKCFLGLPPFYRRLASFAHATLLQRIFSNSNINMKNFYTWINKTSGTLFYFQTYADMSFDSRMSSDFISSTKLKDYFLNRILRVSNSLDICKLSQNLKDLIQIDSDTGLAQEREFSNEVFSGPVDGSEFCSKKLPSEIKSEIDHFQKIKVKSGLTTTFLSWLIKFDNNQMRHCITNFLAKNYQFPISLAKDKNDLGYILRDMSYIASICKSDSLSNHVKKICQQYRNFDDESLSVVHEFECCLISSFAFSNNELRMKFASNWITELSFSTNSLEIRNFRKGLRRMCYIEPKYWEYCNCADATLSAIISSNPNLKN